MTSQCKTSSFQGQDGAYVRISCAKAVLSAKKLVKPERWVAAAAGGLKASPVPPSSLFLTGLTQVENKASWQRHSTSGAASRVIRDG